MLRSFLISMSKLDWAQRAIMRWGFAWRAARRFVAGVNPEDAIQAVRTLNAAGIQASLDHLGENTVRPEDAVQATSDILLILDKIQQSGVQANVSIKLTQVGLSLGDELCWGNLSRILKKAQSCENFIRLDMEDSTCVDKTLNHYKQARGMGFDNLGLVIQSYLYRSAADIKNLEPYHPKVRLCKGAYQEPAAVAYPKKIDVDANYDRLVDCLFDMALSVYEKKDEENSFFPPIPAIATHDLNRISHANEYAKKIGLSPHRYEFQMLYGIRRDLQKSLVSQGYRVRVYVPYGTRWYPYVMRRMAERPANLWFFMSNFFRN